MERLSVKRGDAFEPRTLYALTLHALTPDKNHNVRNTPNGRKLIRELLVLRFGIAAGQVAERVRGMFVFV